ncbi:ABC transporter related [Parafrankia sp. EAN1pec]|uniref:ABC transporter ATP-binding protein n=1 Tax=Parafrankia sp. (strain EAN1pec) TaxID=298653 RepID=UPI00015D9E36|nr:ABC transporter related [Frankia sp. EAN1pec]
MTTRTTGAPDVGHTPEGSEGPAADVVVTDLSIAAAGGRAVLHRVSCDLPAGGTLAVVGTSGAGKTTFALALVGHLGPGLTRTSGGVTIGGVDVFTRRASRARELRRHRIRYLPQDPAASLTPTMRVSALLSEMIRLVGGRRADARARAAAALRAVGLPDDPTFLARYPHQLSGGQRQRLLLALALTGEPDVLVLDEPTANVDPDQAAALLALIEQRRAGRSFSLVLVSHDLAAVAALPGAPELVVLDGGRLVERGAPRDVLDRPRTGPARALSTASRRLSHPPEQATAQPPAQASPRAAGPEPGPAAVPSLSPGPDAVTLRVAGLRVSTGTARRRAEVLRGVDLTVRRGECVGVVGVSGSGKTTLARAVIGLHPWDGGTVKLGGVPLAPAATDRPPPQRRRIGYVFQDPYTSLNPRRPVGEAVTRAYALAAGDARQGGLGEEVAALLADLGLDPELAARRPERLSGGQRQRFALARALATAPDLLICDEVTSALDPVSASAICGLVRGLVTERGLAAVFISHDRGAVGAVADQVRELRDGLLAAPPPGP